MDTALVVKTKWVEKSLFPIIVLFIFTADYIKCTMTAYCTSSVLTKDK